MRKLLVLLAMLFIGTGAFAVTSEVEVFRSNPFGRNYEGFGHPYNYGHGYNYDYNSYHCDCHDGYRNYYSSYTPRRYRSYRGYRRNPAPFLHVTRTFYNNSRTPARYGSFNYETSVDAKIVPISHKSDKTDKSNLVSKDPRLSLVEKTVYGKTFEHQDLGLRLNRLEKSMFNQTYPTVAPKDRIDKLFISYKNELEQIKPEEISRLEKTVFKRTYESEDIKDRVSRLEERVLGAIQSGDINARVKTLNEATVGQQFEPVAQAPYGTCYGGYIPDAKNVSGWRRAMNSLGMMFGGYPTGWTPGISPYYDPYMMDDGGTSQMFYNSRGHYSYSNRRRGSGMGITILD